MGQSRASWIMDAVQRYARPTHVALPISFGRWTMAGHSEERVGWLREGRRGQGVAWPSRPSRTESFARKRSSIVRSWKISLGNLVADNHEKERPPVSTRTRDRQPSRYFPRVPFSSSRRSLQPLPKYRATTPRTLCESFCGASANAARLILGDPAIRRRAPPRYAATPFPLFTIVSTF